MYEEALETYRDLDIKIAQIDNYMVKRDLKRMLRNCDDIYREISRENVNFMRTGRPSAHLLDLRNKFMESVTSLEQYVTLALLSI